MSLGHWRPLVINLARPKRNRIERQAGLENQCNDLQEFMTFVRVSAPEELRLVTGAHILEWRND